MSRRRERLLFVLKQLGDEGKDSGNGLLADEVRQRREGSAHVQLIRAAQVLHAIVGGDECK